jgi:hypothetical protein
MGCKMKRSAEDQRNFIIHEKNGNQMDCLIWSLWSANGLLGNAYSYGENKEIYIFDFAHMSELRNSNHQL